MVDAKSMFYENKNDVLKMELIVPFVPEVSLYDHDFLFLRIFQHNRPISRY